MRRPFGGIDDRHFEIGMFVLSLVLVAVAASLAIWHSFGVVLRVWSMLCAVMEPLAYGLMLCCMLAPLADRIRGALPRVGRLGDDGIRRTVSSVLALGLFVLVVVAFLMMFSGMLTAGITHVPSVSSMIQAMGDDIQGFWATVSSRLSDMGLSPKFDGSGIVSVATGAVGMAMTAGFSMMFAVYFLVDGDRMLAYVRRIVRAVHGDGHEMALQVIDDANRIFAAYFRSQAINAMFLSVVTAVAMAAIGVPYALVVGLLTGIGSLIPYVGPLMGYAAVVFACLIDGSWAMLAWATVATVVIGLVDGNLVYPRLLSDSIEIHPAIVMVALIAGGAIGGIAGILVAMPMAALAKLYADRWLDASEGARVDGRSQGNEGIGDA